MAIVSPASVTLTYGYDPNVTITNKSFYSTEGFYFSLANVLSGTKDFSTNQENLLVLTDNYNLNDKLDDFQEINETEFITKSTISFLSGGIFYYLSAGSTGGNVTITEFLSAATIFNLSFTNNGVTLFSSGSGSGSPCVSIFGTNNLNLQIYPRGDAINTQIFPYAFYGSKIVMFPRTSTEIIAVVGGSLEMQNRTGTGTVFAANQIFYINRVEYNSIPNKGDSNLAKYTSTPNDITISAATSGLPYNYLISTPYQKLDTTLNYINFNIAPLKNYYSPEGLQTPTLSTQLKKYNKIYTGLNTTEGYDKIYLSYKGSEIAKVFTKDKDTYFHFPASATNIALTNSTLVKSGALGGSSPVRSDRIFVKKADYKKYSNWGDYSGIQNGTFFCSWLYAGPSSEPTWMDRYYNPSYVNLTGALTSTAFTSATNNYPNVIWDIPSTQIFNPESLYIYHRIGENDNQTIINSFSGNLTRYYKNWDEVMINEVTGLSSGKLYSYASSAVQITPNTRYESLDTAISYGVTDFTDQELNSNGITLAFYAQNKDWGNIKGSQLVGNYYNGGIGISKNNTLLTPFVTITGNSIFTTNTNFVALKTTPADLGAKNYILKTEYDASYYIVTSTKNLLVYDQDDLAVKSYSLSVSGEIIGAHVIYKNNKKQILVFSKPDTTTITWKKFNVDGTISSSAPVSGTQSGYTAYAIDLNGTPVYYNSISSNSTVDSNNVVFALSGNVLMRGLNSTPTPVLSALSAENVACDQDNNIWVLYARRNLCKLDNYGNVLWDVYLTDAPTGSAVENIESQYPRVINFVSEINSEGALEYKGLIIDPKTQYIFKIDPENGNIEKRLNIDSIGICSSNGDSTGYDYQRKYVYTESNANDITVKTFIRNVNGLLSSEQNVNLNYDVGYLTPGWHHFAVTLDTNNTLKLYVDGSFATSTTVGSLSSIYRIYNNKNNPDLIIGTASFKKQTLSEYTKETNDIYRFNGRIADVRFYTQALQQADIKAIRRQFLLDLFTDLKWSTPTGERYYIEQIERFFAHRLPGSKSNMFNIKIKNSNITDTTLRGIIEKNIIASLNKTIPAHTKLNSIIWD